MVSQEADPLPHSFGRLGQFLTRTGSVLGLMNSKLPRPWTLALSLIWGLVVRLPTLIAGTLWELDPSREGPWRDGAIRRAVHKVE